MNLDLSTLMTDQKSERLILEKMQQSGGFTAIPIGVEFEPAIQNAFNKACETGLFRMVNLRNMDVPIPGKPHLSQKMPAVLYAMTPLGTARLTEHRERERLSTRLGG